MEISDVGVEAAAYGLDDRSRGRDLGFSLCSVPVIECVNAWGGAMAIAKVPFSGTVDADTIGPPVLYIEVERAPEVASAWDADSVRGNRAGSVRCWPGPAPARSFR